MRFIAESGRTFSSPLITNGETVTLHVENNNRLKSAVQDTFAYQLTVNGNYNGLAIDTVINVSGFNKTQMQHTQNVGIETGEAILKGKTFIIGKYADSQFYDADNEAYVNSRKEPNMTFALTNLTGDTIINITSDENAEYEVKLQKKEPHYYMITPGDTHEALVQILIDSTMNIKNIGAANNKGENAMSRADNQMLHMTYWRLGYNEEIKPPITREAKTINWKKQYYFDEGFKFLFIDSVYDFNSNTFTEKLSEEFVDSLMRSRETVNQFTNDIFKNGEEVWEHDFKNVGVKGTVATYGYKGIGAAGRIGRTIQNNVLFRANIGINVGYWNDGTESIPKALYQEQLSMETLFVLAYPEKQNTLDGGGSGPAYINNHAITSVEWGQVRRRAILKDGDEKKGVYSWDMDERGLEAAVNNQYIRDFVYGYGSTEAINKMDELIAGTKAATIPSTRYELVEFFDDKEPKTTIYTKDNYQQLLEENDVNGIDRAVIESLFEE